MPFHKVSSIWYLVSGIKYTKYKILNTKYCKTKGFTLIELLVVLGILAAAVGASMIFLTSVLKGTNQANVTAEVKQNGQVVLDSLEKQIRGATAAVSIVPNGSSSGVDLTKTDGNSLYVVCFDSIASPASNGWIGVADVSPGTDINTGDYESITSRDTISGVDITCTPPLGFKIIPTASGSPPIVSISFMVDQGIDAPSRAHFLP